MLSGGKRGLASGILPSLTGFGLRHPRGAPAGALKSRPVVLAHNIFCARAPLMQTSLQRCAQAQKKMMPVGHHPVCF